MFGFLYSWFLVPLVHTSDVQEPKHCQTWDFWLHLVVREPLSPWRSRVYVFTSLLISHVRGENSHSCKRPTYPGDRGRGRSHFSSAQSCLFFIPFSWRVFRLKIWPHLTPQSEIETRLRLPKRERMNMNKIFFHLLQYGEATCSEGL